ncbi:hypothetical protein Lser_V15G06362 [Lactuca serriola]
MIDQFLALLLLVVLSYVLSFVYKNRKSGRSKINLPPGSFGWPFIGESLSFLRASWDGTPERFVRERIKKHGNPLVFKTCVFGERMAVLYGPAGNKFLFGNENKLVAAWWPSSVKKLFGRCLITIRGDEAKWLRKMMLSYLGPEAFASHYVATMDIITRRHIEVHWRVILMSKGKTEVRLFMGKEKVNVYPTVKLYAFELACRLFMSLEEPNHIAKLASLFNIFLKGIIGLPLNFPGTRFYRSKKAAAAIRKDLMMIIKERKAALEEGKASSSQDLLSHFLTSSDDNGKFLTEMEIANNYLLLLFAGHDTSTGSISLLMKNLGEHPDVYDKVLREQLEISKSKAAGELLKWEDVQKMRYSWNVVCEVMRINSPSIGTYREALIDFEYEGYNIPKGWKLFWSAPSRFEGAGPTPYTYVPFGGGARMCLGKEFSRVEVLVFLHNIVTNFKWDLLVPDEKIEYDPLAAPVNGLPIRLNPHQV